MLTAEVEKVSEPATRIAENIWTIVVSQKIVAKYHAQIMIKTTYNLKRWKNTNILLLFENLL